MPVIRRALFPWGAPASLLWTLLLLVGFSESKLQLSAPEAVTLQLLQQDTVHISSSAPLNETLVLLLNVTSSSISNWSSVVSLPHEVPLSAGSSEALFNVSALAVGQVTAFLNSNRSDLSVSLRIRFLVIHSQVVELLSEVIGWIYFLAWSVSFYPQAWENWTRKSVVGLNLDFLALNLTGFFAYSVFNIALFWVQPIKEEYLKRDPNGVIPVTASDVFFSLHALLLCSLYVCQAALYQRGGQTVSWPARGLLLLGWTFALVTLFLAVAQVITWLQYIYYFSYIKLAVTLVKYMPQAYMNYQRKSTVGWSIGNVLLDFTGGVLSILQMVLQSYNNDQWMLFFGNPTKFGLGLFSVLFDLLFISQHYCLYRTKYQPLPSEEQDPDQDCPRRTAPELPQD
ncbi:hypothetical protein NQD34_002751 [Periophthalmus magnuspinnatus]|uniref:cystinosin isoform X1 n=1 Tax=Periophthalmus magnuspinnatus TaxID=409849 RepID=UPI00145B6501|nr:cystinosin isoform X1 [Periophthalmus magnuspinnatus]XP_055077221.1 cystinosin isoform X1 [Periophthalmus magnuspinnatus]KAJ0032670.1 hypothetical protein NQD34_002751 [Periophthalmus magnuspinnatus]